MGLKVPDDVLVTGWDNTPESRYVVPSLTTISPDKKAIARNAVQALDHLIQGHDDPPTPEVISHRLIVRDSTGLAAAQ